MRDTVRTPPEDQSSTKLRYELPMFLEGTISQKAYTKWLYNKAATHVRRDRSRTSRAATPAEYRRAIHEAVCRCQGVDEYTGRPLSWELVSTYDNAKAAKGGTAYKRRFYRLPTVDHAGDDVGQPRFKICSWQVNDAKHDQTYSEFVEMCSAVLAWKVRPNSTR